MSSTGVHHICARQGETFKLNFVVRVGDVDADGAPIKVNGKQTSTPMDLSGYTAHMQVRRKPDSDVVFDFSTDSEITLGGVAGTVAVVGAAAVMAAQTATKYMWDIDLIAGVGVGGEVLTPLAGAFTLEPQVTKT